MKTPSQKSHCIQYAKATCDLRDRLWKFTNAHFRRLNRNPRNPDALLQHLEVTQEVFEKAKIEVQRPINVEGIKKNNEAANKALLQRNPHLAEQPWRLWKTDPRKIAEQEKEGRRYKLEHLQEEMEPHRAASVPLYERDYQPRYWNKLVRAGLIHDGMVCFPKAALRLLEAKTTEAN